MVSCAALAPCARGMLKQADEADASLSAIREQVVMVEELLHTLLLAVKVEMMHRRLPTTTSEEDGDSPSWRGE